MSDNCTHEPEMTTLEKRGRRPGPRRARGAATMCLVGDVALVALTEGKFATIDKEDFDLISNHTWSVASTGYAQARVHGKVERMHRLIMRTPRGMSTDHINGNKLDNRRSNLRTCTHAENLKNMKPHKRGLPKGVYPAKDGMWRSCIMVNYKNIHLGATFKTIEEAHAAYCEASKKYHGEFSRTK